MRISTIQTYQQGLNSMLEQQVKLSRTQAQIASGQRIQTPADDPAGATQLLNLNEETSIVDQYQRNIDAAKVKLSQEETALQGGGNILQRVRELTVQANSDSESAESRRAIATEMRSQLNQLLATANTRDANGEYLFAGFQTNTSPFALGGAGPVYSGDQGQRFIQTGPTSQVATGDSGADVFQMMKTGNGVFAVQTPTTNTGSAMVASADVAGTFVPDTYTLSFIQALPSDPVSYQVSGAVSGVVASGTYVAGQQISFGGVALGVEGTPANGDSLAVAPSTRQDIFTSLNNIIAALEAPSDTPADRAKLHNAVSSGLENLDQGMNHLLSVRTQVGSRLEHLDSQDGINQDYLLQVKEIASSVGDLDYAEATTRLNLQTVALQAAQQAYIKVQGLSLFKYL